MPHFQFESTETQISSLLSKLPEFSSQCEEFSQVSAGIRTRRRLNTMTLKLNAQLLQILEIPQLMDSCIRAGLYEDALRLATYVKKMERRHADIPVVLVSHLAIHTGRCLTWSVAICKKKSCFFFIIMSFFGSHL